MPESITEEAPQQETESEEQVELEADSDLLDFRCSRR